MDEGIAGFDFNEGGRTYTCSVGPLGSGRGEAWWWFRVAEQAGGGGGVRGASLSARERQWLPDEPANRPVVESAVQDRHRYAPFRAEATDTRGSVQARVVAYYDDLVARRSLPSNHYWRQRPRAPQPQTTAVPPR